VKVKTKMAGKIVEIIGCAASGKSSVTERLSQRDSSVQTSIPSFEYKIRSAKCTIYHLPMLLLLLLLGVRRHYLKTLIGVEAALAALQTYKKKHPSGKTLVLDQGPLSKLAYLYTKGLPNRIVGSWLQTLQAKATEVFDRVIWLDAPNSVLQSRINQRNNHHKMKNKPKELVDQFYDDYRAAFTKILIGPRHTFVLEHIGTAEMSIEQVAEQVSRQLKQD
jgi:thymidylate kinase